MSHWAGPERTSSLDGGGFLVDAVLNAGWQEWLGMAGLLAFVGWVIWETRARGYSVND